MLFSRNNSFVIDSENDSSDCLDGEEQKYSAFKSKKRTLKQKMIKSNQVINKDIRKSELRTLSPRQGNS